MNLNIFNHTIFLWAGAIAVALLIVNPRAALVQRINTMNEPAMDCLRNENCHNTRDITEAREYYEILAQLYPDYGRGFEMQGVCYLLLKQDGLAIKKFKEAIKHNPNLWWVSFELGKAYYRRGEYVRALECFQSITAQDNNILIKKATLSTLRQFPDKTREALMLGLIDFVMEIKLRSYQMAIGCLVHQGDMAQAKNMINSGLKNPSIGQNEFFDLADRSMSDDNAKKEMITWIDSLAYGKTVFHPWGNVIPPLKEILYP